jgi:hypothetical protein
MVRARPQVSRKPLCGGKMEDWQRRQVDEWHRRGYLPRLGDLAKSFAAPFWWHNPERPVGSAVKRNGTMVFVDTGSRILGVTAEHVYRGYVSDFAEDRDLVCQVGGITFRPEDRLIEADQALDLATFELSEVLVVGSRSNIYRRVSWPPAPLATGELALLGGFPGALRGERVGETDFDFAWFITRADSSSPRHTGILLNLAEAHSPTGVRLPPGADLGGASGGPVFQLHDGAISPLELVGFIYEYSASMELIYARHAASVSADGSLHPA